LRVQAESRSGRSTPRVAQALDLPAWEQSQVVEPGNSQADDDFGACEACSVATGA